MPIYHGKGNYVQLDCDAQTFIEMISIELVRTFLLKVHKMLCWASQQGWEEVSGLEYDVNLGIQFTEVQEVSIHIRKINWLKWYTNKILMFLAPSHIKLRETCCFPFTLHVLQRKPYQFLLIRNPWKDEVSVMVTCLLAALLLSSPPSM